MRLVMDNADSVTRQVLQKLRESVLAAGQQLDNNGNLVLKGDDAMDDGTKIVLTVGIAANGSATMDFTGTGAPVLGNWNAPRAITTAAVLYSLRLLVAADIPLNSGGFAVPVQLVCGYMTVCVGVCEKFCC